MNSKDKLEKIKQLIYLKSLQKLKKFFKEYNIFPNDYNNFNELLIYAIESDTSDEILEYIIQARADKNLNFSIVMDNKVKIPLFVALKNNYFDKADTLIKNKANINYAIDCENIFKFLYNRKFINVRNLKYILNKGFDIEYITTHDFHSLVENGEGKFLEIIFDYINYNSNLVLDLINSSKNKTSIHNTTLNEALKKEKEKLNIDEYMYRKADEKEYNDILRILFINDRNSKNKLYMRIIKYNLLEKSFESNDYNYVKKVFNIKPFNYKCINYDKILIKAIEGLKDSNNDRKKISKLFIDSSIYDSINVNNDSDDTLNNISYNQYYFNLLLNFSIKNNDMEAIKYLIENEEYKTNLDINVKDINGEYPLINALYQEQNEIIKYLIEHGGNCNIKNNNGIPLLVLAIQKNNDEIVEYILQKPGININEKCENGYSAFMTAINQNNTNLVELILDYSDIVININEKDAIDNIGQSILFFAVDENDIETVKYLINCGANLNIRDKYKNSVIDYAIFNGNSKILDILLQSDNISLKEYNSAEETPLISLIKSKKFSEEDKEHIINNFIDKGCDIDKPDKKNNLPPLIHAIRSDELSITQLLICLGANINKKNNTGHSYVRYGVNYSMGDYKDFYSSEITKFIFETELYNIINDKNLLSSEIKDNDINKIKRLIPTIININEKNALN
eukprot:jgi/Orpsp1_1/1175067/evm.model.c7180000052510.2